MANNVDPDETAHNKPSHLDLHNLHRYLSARRKGLINWHNTFVDLLSFQCREIVNEVVEDFMNLYFKYDNVVEKGTYK